MAEMAAAAFTWAVQAGTKALMSIGFSKAAAYATTKFVIKTTLLTASSMALNSILAPRVDASGPPTEWVADPNGPIPYLIGTRGVAGRIVHQDAYGPDNRFKSIVTVVSGAGPIKSFGTFKADRTSISFGANGVSTTGGQFAGNMWMQTAPGLQPQLAALAQSGLPGGGSLPGWTAASKISGKAHFLWSLRQDSKFKTYPIGEPEPLWDGCEGIYGWDPRLDSTFPGGSGPCRLDDPSTHVWINRPGLAALNWALGFKENGQVVAGMGNSLSSVDVAAHVELENICDANGWRVGAFPTTDDDKHQVYIAFLQAGGAIYSKRAGKLSPILRTPKVSVATVSAADTAGALELDTSTPRGRRFNSIIAECAQASHDWKVVPVATVKEAAYLAADGGEKRETKATYSYVIDAVQAGQLAAYDLVDSRETLRGRIAVKPYLRKLKPGDVFTITEPGFALDGARCIVLEKETDPKTGRAMLVFRSEAAGKDAYALGQDPTPPQPPVLSEFDPYDVPAPGVAAWSAAMLAGRTPGIVVTGALDDDREARALRVEIRPLIDAAGAAVTYPDINTGWDRVGEYDVDATRIAITGLRAETPYEVAVSYVSPFNVPGERRSLGSVTTGAMVAELADDADAVGGVPSNEVLRAGLPPFEGVFGAIGGVTFAHPDPASAGDMVVSPGYVDVPGEGRFTLASAFTLDTPFSGAVTPPGQRWFVMYSHEPASLRFGAGFANSRFVCAIYDDALGEWRAVTSANARVAITPRASDILLARVFKGPGDNDWRELTSWVTPALVDRDQILAGAVDQTKFASGLTPVEIVGALPSTGNFQGRQAFLVADNKLYRYNGSAWTRAVATGDLAGQVQAAQIAPGAVLADKLADAAVQVAKLADGAVIAAKIAAGAVTNDKIGALAVNADKLAANAVTLAKIADGAVDTAKITAGAITADKLGAAAVAAGKIAAGAVSAAELAANAVLSNKLADNAVQVAKLADGAVIAAKLADAAVQTSKLSPNAVTAEKIAAGSITTEKLAVGSNGNAIANSDFSAGLLGWYTSSTSGHITELSLRSPGSAFALPTRPTLLVAQNNSDASGYTDLRWSATNSTGVGSPPPLKVQPGERIHAQARVSAHRCTCSIGVEYCDANGGGIAYAPFMDNVGVSSSSTEPDAWPLLTSTSVAPAGAVYANIFLRKNATSSGTDSYMFVHKPMLTRLPINATETPDYASGSVVAITGEGIVANSITAAQIAANTITAAQIAAGTITTAELAASSVTASQIAAGAVTAAKISAGAVTADKIAANAVTAGKIAAGAVSAAEIAAGAITADKIAANAVSADKIAANAVTAAKISAGAVVAGKIAAGVVTAAELAAGSITTEKLAVGSNGNAIANSDFSAGLLGWYTTQHGGNVTSLDLRAPGSSWALPSRPTLFIHQNDSNSLGYTDLRWRVTNSTGAGSPPPLKVQPGERIHAQARVSAHGCSCELRIHFTDINGGTVSYTADTVNNGNSSSSTEPDLWPLLTSTGIAPAGAAFATIHLRKNATSSGADSYMFVHKPMLTRLPINATETPDYASGSVVAITGEGIVANSITAAQIAANTITAAQIAAGTITTAELAASSVTASQIAAGAVTAAKISAGAVTADKIAADAVSADKIAANAVTAGKIAAGAVSAAEIAAGAITADKIAAAQVTAAALAAGAVTADKIAVNAIDASKIQAGVITAEKLAAGSVTADKIGANAVTADKIAANAVSADKIQAGAVSADKISAGAITAEKLAAGAITAEKIAAGTITAEKIVAGNLGTRKKVELVDHYLVPAGDYANGAAAQGNFVDIDVRTPNQIANVGDEIELDIEVYIEANAKIFNHFYYDIRVFREINNSDVATGTGVVALQNGYMNLTQVSGNAVSAKDAIPDTNRIRLTDTIPSGVPTDANVRYHIQVRDRNISGAFTAFEGWADGGGTLFLIAKRFHASARLFSAAFAK